MKNIFINFIEKYSGPKLAFVITGGGIGINELAQTPGVSKILHTIVVPYAIEESDRFIYNIMPNMRGEYNKKAVSGKSARLLCHAGQGYWPDCRVVACTAATTTNRYRRGLNEAYIAVGELDSIDTYHLPLTKLSKEKYLTDVNCYFEKRKEEDKQITEFLLEKIRF